MMAGRCRQLVESGEPMNRRILISLALMAASIGLPTIGRSTRRSLLEANIPPTRKRPSQRFPGKPEQQEAIIKVIVVGGCGGNAIDHMIGNNVAGIKCICIDTDANALIRRQTKRVMQLALPRDPLATHASQS